MKVIAMGMNGTCMTPSAATIEERLGRAGFVLPSPPRPAGAYQPVVIRGQFGFVSGQFPFRDGVLALTGRVGAELLLEQGREAARIAACNVMAQMHAALGDWKHFAGMCRIEGYVASAADFVQQPRVMDAASELILAALGAKLGAHTRAAFAVPRLPLDAPIELVAIFATCALIP